MTFFEYTTAFFSKKITYEKKKCFASLGNGPSVFNNVRKCVAIQNLILLIVYYGHIVWKKNSSVVLYSDVVQNSFRHRIRCLTLIFSIQFNCVSESWHHLQINVHNSYANLPSAKTLNEIQHLDNMSVNFRKTYI